MAELVDALDSKSGELYARVGSIPTWGTDLGFSERESFFYDYNKDKFVKLRAKMIIRKENPQDYRVVEELIKETFETARHSDGDEHNLVARLRKSDGFIEELSLVAEKENEIVGHILFTKAQIGSESGLALAPLSVAPLFQNQGIGSSLVNYGHKIARSLGYDLIVVLGDPNYYQRFGYQPASHFKITSPFTVPDENFMAVSLIGVAKHINGEVKYVKEILVN